MSSADASMPLRQCRRDLAQLGGQPLQVIVDASFDERVRRPGAGDRKRSPGSPRAIHERRHGTRPRPSTPPGARSTRPPLPSAAYSTRVSSMAATRDGPRFHAQYAPSLAAPERPVEPASGPALPCIPFRIAGRTSRAAHPVPCSGGRHPASRARRIRRGRQSARAAEPARPRPATLSTAALRSGADCPNRSGHRRDVAVHGGRR
jgi:hypothetical protein